MEWKEWKPRYEEIVADLGLDAARDAEAARLLSGMLAGTEDALSPLQGLIQGREVAVFGPAPFPDPDTGVAVRVSAGSATEMLIAKGIWPHIIVTDLDGDVRVQAEANRRGAIAVIHAHGDNMGAIRRWVPEFRAPLLGTTQAEPFGRMRNFGGFTDGDRAVLMAAHLGAGRIILKGFDFKNPAGKPGTDAMAKRNKLGHARRLIEHAAEKYGMVIIGL